MGISIAGGGAVNADNIDSLASDVDDLTIGADTVSLESDLDIPDGSLSLASENSDTVQIDIDETSINSLIIGDPTESAIIIHTEPGNTEEGNTVNSDYWVELVGQEIHTSEVP